LTIVGYRHALVSPASTRFAVLASGSGTNLQALIDARIAGLAVVISDVSDSGALLRAREAGLPAEFVPHGDDRIRNTELVCEVAIRHGAGALVLAGFMRILGPAAIRAFPDRIVNIHPSLLPAFPGVDAVAQALAAGVKVSGVTVHFVDEQIDHGPIIAQRAVPVLPEDDVDSLHARIRKEEHDLYPRVVRALITGRLTVKERRVIWS
jgi:phosphoribosylglycinamide formyltransferase-1